MTVSGARGVLLSCMAVVMLGLASAGAYSASVTNRDNTARSLKVIEASKATDHDLAPGKSLDDVCNEGCIVRIDGSPEKDFVLEGTERVSIEGGLLYYDGEVAPGNEPAR
jgi:hypothetical protein